MTDLPKKRVTLSLPDEKNVPERDVGESNDEADFTRALGMYMRLGIEKERLRDLVKDVRAAFEERKHSLTTGEKKVHLEQLQEALLQYSRLNKQLDDLGQILLQHQLAGKARTPLSSDVLSVCKIALRKTDGSLRELHEKLRADSQTRTVSPPPRQSSPASSAGDIGHSAAAHAGGTNALSRTVSVRPGLPRSGSPPKPGALATTSPQKKDITTIIAEQQLMDIQIEKKKADDSTADTFNQYAKVQEALILLQEWARRCGLPPSMLERATWADVEVLASFTDGDLEDEMGIEQAGDREAVLDACATLRRWMEMMKDAEEDRGYKTFTSALQKKNVQSCMLM